MGQISCSPPGPANSWVRIRGLALRCSESRLSSDFAQPMPDLPAFSSALQAAALSAWVRRAAMNEVSLKLVVR